MPHPHATESAHARGHRRAGALVCVLVLVLLALVLRATGVGFGLPAVIEDDSGVLVRQIEMVRDRTPAAERDENWKLYPHLIAEVAGRFAPDDTPRAQDDTVPELLSRASQTHVFARWAVLLLALGAIPFTWLVARRFCSQRGAVLAAALVATSLLFQCFSQEARPHAAAAAAVLLALHACMVLVERGDVTSFLYAGVAGGLALGTLQSNALVAAPLLLACAFRGRARVRAAAEARERPGTISTGSTLEPGAERRTHGAWTLAALALLALGYVVFYPAGDAAGTGRLVELDGAARTVRFFGHNVALGEFDARGFATVFWSLWSFETLASVLAVLALAVWIVRIRGRLASFDWFAHPRLFVLAAYAVLHLVAIGMYARTYERFCLQLVPLLCILSAWGAERIVERWPRARLALGLAWVVFALVPAVNLARLRAGPLAQEEAGGWLTAHVRAEEGIRLHVLTDVPILRTAAALAADARAFTMPWRGYTPWRRFQSRVPPEACADARLDVRPLKLVRPKDQAAFEADPGAWLAESGARYVVLPLQAIREGPEVFRILRRACRERGDLAARFPARADGETDVVLGFEDRIESARPHWMWSLLARAPIAVEVVEVWRVH